MPIFGSRCGFLVVLLAALLASPVARASWGEKYLDAGAGYFLLGRVDGQHHAPGVRVGGGWHISDFALVDAHGWYAPSPGEPGWLHLTGVSASFRFLLDATQWVPSVGPGIGWVAHLGGGKDFSHGVTLGLSGCLDHRSRREWSVGLCGDISLFAWPRELSKLLMVVVQFSWFK
jgi:hypothetical protein